MELNDQESYDLESLKKGSCELTINRKTKEYFTMTLAYSEDVLLTPNFWDACLFYQAVKTVMVERCTLGEYREFERGVRPYCSSSFWPFQPLLKNTCSPERTGPFEWFQVSSGPVTCFAKPERIRELYDDLCDAAYGLGLVPETYFEPCLKVYGEKPY